MLDLKSIFGTIFVNCNYGLYREERHLATLLCPCHTFRLLYMKNGPADIAKTNQFQYVMLTDEDST